MDRPARIKKAVDYSDFMNDDDEDFAAVKAPPSKKARASGKEATKEPAAPVRGCKERVSLDDRKYNRDLEAALALSCLNPAEHTEESPTNNPENRTGPEDSPPVLLHFSEESRCTDKASSPPPPDAPPVLSNCSVNASGLGLDEITSDQSFPSAVGSKRTSQKPTKSKRRGSDDDDDDEEEYKPQDTPESDSELSDADQSEDEEYSVKKNAQRNKSKTEKKPAVKRVRKEKTTAKTPKTKPSTVKKQVLNQSPAATRPVSTLKRAPITPPTTKATAHSSPGGRLPKWTPPGVIGRSPGSCPSPSARSPGLGLRLGLSRLARVKPLHHNSVAH